MTTIPYGKQTLDQDDIESVVNVLERNTFLTTGPWVREFEEKVASFTKKRYAVSVNSGTAALHCAVRALNIKKGDEIIVPAISFVASANCVLYEQGVPVFVDIDPRTMNIDPTKIEEKICERTKAIIVVHFTGQLCEMKQIREIADRHNLKIIEDAAHAIGTEGVCQYGDMATFSFHPVKNMTTGEGGMIVTDNKEYYELMKRFRCHGIDLDYKDREKQGSYDYDMCSLGFNYRLTDIQSALGISQLRKLPQLIRRRKEIAKKYDLAFRSCNHIETLEQTQDNSYHLYVVKVKGNRDLIFEKLKSDKINVNVHYKPIYLQSFYQKLGYKKGLCPVAEQVYESIITLPIFPTLTIEDQDRVIGSLTRLTS